MNELIVSRIGKLRDKMKQNDIDLAIVPHVDPHQSEYMSAHWHLREYFSGFSGSAGTLVVTATEALLWADSRYFLQAAEQLEGTGIKLMKIALPGTPTINEYITSTLKPNQKVGIDGMLFSVNAFNELKNLLAKKGIGLVADFKPTDGIWLDRPALPDNKIFIHDESICGQSCSSKIADVLAEAKKSGADSTVVCALDAIAWVLNLRGSDVKYNPVFTAFLYLAEPESILFIDHSKLTPEVETYLHANNITTAPYESLGEFLGKLPSEAKVLVDPASSSSSVATALGDRCILGDSPIALMKGIKNPVQLKGMIEAHIRDGVALTKAFMEIERKLSTGERLTEMGVAEILSHYRGLHEYYFDDSFGTICGYRGHGAIVHYEADEKSDAELKPDGLLLIDSGAQYLDGTTDITRTISLGNPTDDERHDFTLVLKGHIGLASAVFPEGTRGSQLDILAHLPLWKEGKTYLHGTGHGVGHFLNVHEGPHSIRTNENPVTIHAGMVTSNEPGLYITGKYGIRTENVILAEEAFDTEYGKYLRFRTITMFPIDITLCDTSIMSDDEICWINEYHKTVRETLSPRLNDEELKWLKNATRKLSRNSEHIL
ncbi:MAG: aminopeptidase P family protein [Muribaculum sp.]|nr:aminopeptidase P family protein [Muribaculum sp.]